MIAITFCYVFSEKHVLLDIFEQQTENWHFQEKSPHKVPYLPLREFCKYTPILWSFYTSYKGANYL